MAAAHLEAADDPAAVIQPSTFDRFYRALEAGERRECMRQVEELLDAGVEVQRLYAELLQAAMERIGERWQRNEISVATEHLATTITEGLLNLVYPRLFAQEKNGRKIVLACVSGEHHQIGPKMVADTFELNGWDSYFVGANTPHADLLEMVSAKQPDAVGLSASQLQNLASVRDAVRRLRATFPSMPILVGGRAFAGTGGDVVAELNALSEKGEVRYFTSVLEAHEALGRGQLR